MKQSPTQLSLKHLRKTCQIVQVVEHWNPFSRTRQDLFGIVDILALRGAETVACQSTSWSNISARIKKIADSEAIEHIRNANWIFIVHGWRMGKNGRYELREENIS